MVAPPSSSSNNPQHNEDEPVPSNRAKSRSQDCPDCPQVPKHARLHCRDSEDRFLRIPAGIQRIHFKEQGTEQEWNPKIRENHETSICEHQGRPVRRSLEEADSL